MLGLSVLAGAELCYIAAENDRGRVVLAAPHALTKKPPAPFCERTNDTSCHLL